MKVGRYVLKRCPLLLLDGMDYIYIRQLLLLKQGFPVKDDSSTFAEYVLLLWDKVDTIIQLLKGLAHGKS